MQRPQRRAPGAAALVLAILLALAFPAIPSAAGTGPAGAVYVLTNDARVNAVMAFARADDGRLSLQGKFATGGRGTGAGLGSQGALVLDGTGSLLFAVNAGTNTVSSFRVEPTGLDLVGTFPSGGLRPISLTVRNDLLYVLNAGGIANVAGYRLAPDGMLSPIRDSRRPLSNAFPNPAQVGISPDSRTLVVTEKSTDRIDVYPVGTDGRPGAPTVERSVGIEPFGFAFDRSGHLLVSEAFNGGPGRSAVTSYQPVGTHLDVISPSVGTTQTAACWVVITADGRYSFVTNTGSGTASSYQIAADGTIDLLDPVAADLGMHSAPLDLDLTADDSFVYVLASGLGEVSGFSVSDTGQLTAVGDFGMLPPSASGLAAR